MEAIISAVDMTTVTAGVGTIFAGLALTYVAIKGGKILLGLIRG